jgi:hypothetical protein
MGTVYVFCEQCIQEMLVLYSCGDQEQYRRLVMAHYIVFTMGCALCATVSIHPRDSEPHELFLGPKNFLLL